MDEIELLQTFRVDPLGPDLGTTERARAKLRTAIALERGQERVARKPRWRRRRLIPAALVATAAMAIAALIVVTGSSGPGVSEAAAEALRQQARIAAAQPAIPPPKSGQYLYTKTRETGLISHASRSGGYRYWNTVLRESWLGTDSPGRLRTVAGRDVFLTPDDRSAWRAAGSPPLTSNGFCGQRICDDRASHGLRVRDLSDVPTDPDRVQQLIEQRKLESGPPGDAETFAIIGDLLRETYAPPKFRAALYRVASQLPDIKLLGAVRDGAGRKGVAVGYVIGDQREDLIFDPKTSALLGERSVVVARTTDPNPEHPEAAPVGTVVYEATYLKSGVVDSRSVRP
jgi:hypothetical protein